MKIHIGLWFLVLTVVSQSAFSHTIEIASVGGNGQLADAARHPTISADGRYVVFLANGLTATGGSRIANAQWYLRDRLTQTTELLSQSSVGLPAVSSSSLNVGLLATMDNSGRYVAFEMALTGFDGQPLSPFYQIFIRDRLLRTTRQVSGLLPSGVLSSRGAARPYLSGDGKFVTFLCGSDVFFPDLPERLDELCLLNLLTGQNTRATKTLDGAPMPPSLTSNLNPSAISDDGDAVYFTALTERLVANDTNEASDVFVYRRSSNSVQRLSTDEQGNQLADGGSVGQISRDGQKLLFGSSGRGLPGVPLSASNANRWFVKDLQTGAIQLLCKTAADLNFGEPTGVFGCNSTAAISGDGSAVVFGGNSELPEFAGGYQVYRADLSARRLQLWSRNEAGVPCNAFCGSVPQGPSFVVFERPQISFDGKHVAFWVQASTGFNMVPGVSFLGREAQILVRSDAPLAGPTNTVLAIPTTSIEARALLVTLLLMIGFVATRVRAIQ